MLASPDRENRPEKNGKSESEENCPRLCIVLCREKEPGSLERADEIVKEVFGPEYWAEVEEADKVVTVYRGEQAIGILAHMPAPVPDGEAAENAAGNILWPDGESEAAAHQSHVIVTTLSEESPTEGLTPVEAALRLTRLALVALKLFDGFAVYWGAAPVTNSREVFEDFAEEMNRGTHPVPIWLRYGVDRNPDGSFNVYTWGMKQFGLMDLEFERCRMDLPDLLEFVWDVVEYLIEQGPVIKDGDTVGRSADERFKVRHAMSTTLPRRRVYKVLCDETVDADSENAG